MNLRSIKNTYNLLILITDSLFSLLIRKDGVNEEGRSNKGDDEDGGDELDIPCDNEESGRCKGHSVCVINNGKPTCR